MLDKLQNTFTKISEEVVFLQVHCYANRFKNEVYKTIGKFVFRF